MSLFHGSVHVYTQSYECIILARYSFTSFSLFLRARMHSLNDCVSTHGLALSLIHS